MEEIRNKFYRVIEICEKINDLTIEISVGEINFFTSISIEVKFNNPEQCFENLISWFYVRCIEMSGKNVDFIQKKLKPNNISVSLNASNFQKLIHAFRTNLHHNLDLVNSQRDIGIKNTCDEWMRNKLGTGESKTESSWKSLNHTILDESIEFLDGIFYCLNVIADSEHTDVVIKEWERLIKRNYTPFDFEQVLIIVLENLGLTDFFDTRVLTQLSFTKWRHQLDVLPENFNFQSVAYKIIESFVVQSKIIPIDGNDLIAMGVPKGPRVSQILLKAKDLFSSKPCFKSELLEQLKEYL